MGNETHQSSVSQNRRRVNSGRQRRDPPCGTDRGRKPFIRNAHLNIGQAGAIVVIKRAMAKGFAGVDNPLCFDSKTRVLFRDAKHSLSALVRELQGAA